MKIKHRYYKQWVIIIMIKIHLIKNLKNNQHIFNYLTIYMKIKLKKTHYLRCLVNL